MNIGAKNYDDPAYQAQLARLDVVILGFYRGWRGDTDGSVIRRAVQAMKALNPALKVGQYTMLGEAQDSPLNTSDHDLSVELDATNWWLRDASTGARLQWTTAYGTWEINLTEWTKADAAGDRWPQWLAKRDHRVLFQPVPEFDIWYFDNVVANSRVKAADWKLDGTNWPSADPGVAAAYRRGHAAEWQTAAALAPTRLQMGNVATDLAQPEYRLRLGAAFLEAQMGRSWSIETWAGWLPMMQRYFDVTHNLRAPALVGFNVSGSPSDYRFFRYAFTSCLLGDGHFSFTDAAVGYSSVPWFDEYEVALGAPTGRATLQEWSNGVYRRRYENALVLVNPQKDARTVKVGAGWRRLLATQDPVTNSGASVRTLTLPAKDGIVLVRR
ncbi:MAG: putative glycoside hydrolase [Betaproteobacteria bacterium]